VALRPVAPDGREILAIWVGDAAGCEKSQQ